MKLRIGFLGFLMVLCTLAGTGWAQQPQGHYLVLKVDRLGNVQPVFHRAVDVEARPMPEKSLREKAARSSSQLLAETAAWAEIAEIPPHLRGEFAADGQGGQIIPHRVPLNEHYFALRIPASAGNRVSVSYLGRKTTLDLGEISAKSSSLPFAGSSGARSKRAAVNSANRLDILVIGDGYTAAEQAQFQTHFTNLRNTFLAHTPYAEYASFVNWESLFVASNQSGADHPPYQAGCTTTSCCADTAAQDDPRAGLIVDTAFDGTFCTAQIHRLVTVSYGKVLAAASAAPHWDQIIVIVNDPVYGGAGGAFSVATANEWSSHIAVHEFGHTFTRLADEYTTPYPGFPNCSDTGGGYPCEVNVTNQTDRSLIKWNYWIGASTPIPTSPGTTGIGLFEGARYQETGMYRPEHTCAMRNLAVPFCNVCSQAYVMMLYAGGSGFAGGPNNGIKLIEPGSASPSASAPVAYETGSTRTFSAVVLRPSPNTTSIQWYLDGQAIVGATGTSFGFFQAQTTPVSRTLEMRVTDNTPLVNRAVAGDRLVHSQQWSITISRGRWYALRDDFNGDGVSDLFWHNTNSLASQIWRSGNNNTQQAVTTVNNKTWKIVGAGDFNGNGASDLLWRNTSTGANAIWLSANNNTQQGIVGVTNQSWQVAGTGDFNGDGISDILWHNTSSLANTIWLSANNATQQQVTTVNNRQWVIAGIGDFDGDGRADILWRNHTTGANAIWLAGNNATQQPIVAVTNRAWKIVGVADFNGDGKSDILWHNTSTLANTIWLSGNNGTQQSVVTVANKAWSIAGVGDYNGDGKSDILWRNSSTKANTIWLSANNATQQAVATVRAEGWQVLRF